MLSRLLYFGFVLLTFALPARAAIQVGIDRIDQSIALPRLVQSWKNTVTRFDSARRPYPLY